MILKFIKKIFLILLRTFKKLSSLDKLTTEEKKGKIFKLTKLKFVPHTKIIVPFALGRSIRGLSFQEHLEKDPFAVFIDNISKGDDKDIIIENLFSHIKKEKFANAAITVDQKNNLNISKYPSWALVMPWEKISIKKKYKIYKNQFIFDRSVYEPKMKKGTNINDIDIMYSYDYVYSQYTQTKKLLENIRTNGLKSFSYNDSPKIYILIDNNEWRWCMSKEGNHRAYISHLLGNKSFECVIAGIIDKKNIFKCYNVKSGLYSSTEARIIFDHFFFGDKCLGGLV